MLFFLSLLPASLRFFRHSPDLVRSRDFSHLPLSIFGSGQKTTFNKTPRMLFTIIVTSNFEKNVVSQA
jgi:hypothetical protein